MAIGADCGTYNLVVCKRDDKGNFVFKREVNAFLEMELQNDFVFNMMKQAGVPLIHREDANIAYALGEAAINIAYTMNNLELKRPMKDGCVNPSERDAFQIMSIMIHSLLDDLKKDQEVLYYSVPANAINEVTDADYHRKVLEAIFKAFKNEQGWSVDARPINEGMAVVYSELKKKFFTGLGASFGAGMVNVAFSLFGAEVFSFALVNSGDWIDKQAAKATGESIAFINKEKTKVDLNREPTTLVERAIKTQYELMIEKTVTGIKKGLTENKDKNARLDQPLDIVITGGTSSPPGFDTLFEKLLRQADMPLGYRRCRAPDRSSLQCGPRLPDCGRECRRQMNYWLEQHREKTKESILCSQDFPYFCEKYLSFEGGPWWRNSGPRPFAFYPYQQRLYRAFEDNRFVAVKKFRQGGFSKMAVAYLLWRSIFKQDEHNVIFTQRYRTSNDYKAWLRQFIRQLPDWMQQEVDFNFGSTITFLSGSSLNISSYGASKGRSIDHCILDEVAFWGEIDQFWKAVYPCLACGGKCFVMSTPNGVVGSGQWFYKTYAGAVKKINSFVPFEAQYSENPEFTDEWAADVKRNLGDLSWRQEYLCEFVEKIGDEWTTIKLEE
jgi:actin-like ATPase involved in cell morphogenesis